MVWCGTPADTLVHSNPAPPVLLDQQEEGRASMVVQEVLDPQHSGTRTPRFY